MCGPGRAGDALAAAVREPRAWPSTQIVADQLCIAMPMGLTMDEKAWPLPALLFQIRGIKMASNGATVGSGRYVSGDGSLLFE
jgi:hypothetical protein